MCHSTERTQLLHKGSELLVLADFLVLLHQVNTSWRHENKAGGRQWLLLRLCLAARTLAVFILMDLMLLAASPLLAVPSARRLVSRPLEEALAYCSDPESSPRPKAPSKTGVLKSAKFVSQSTHVRAQLWSAYH